MALAFALTASLHGDPIISKIVLAPDRIPYFIPFQDEWYGVVGLQHAATDPVSLETLPQVLPDANASSHRLMASMEADSRQPSQEETANTNGKTDLRMLILVVLLVGGLVRYLTSAHFIAILQDVFGPLHEY